MWPAFMHMVFGRRCSTMGSEEPESGSTGLRIRRTGPGMFALRLPGPEREMLGSLLPELRQMVLSDDPSARRLSPPAYPFDVAAETEFRELTHKDLVAARLAAIERVEATLGASHLDGETLYCWSDVINSLRLVIGTGMNVSESLPDLHPQDPAAPALAVYEYLGWLLEEAVVAMSADLAPGHA